MLLAGAAQSDTTTYVYDALGRLVQVTGTAGTGTTSSYTYDPADNRSNVTVTTGTPTCSGVTFTIASNGPVTEGTSSGFTVTKSGTATGSCNVNYATADGTAAAPGDYTSTSNTLTFTSAQTSQTFNVTTIDDAAVESAETFTASLSSPTGGATLGTPNSVSAIINDNDTAPACSGVTFTIASNGAVTEGTNSGFTVTKTGTATGSCDVSYATANGTAAAPGDYTTASGTLTFTSAQTSQPVSVTTIDDTTGESAETFTMSLSSPTGGATLGTPNTATAIINDNDNQPPTPVNDTGTQQKCTTATYNVTANDTDPDGDYPLAVTNVTGAGNWGLSPPSEITFTSLNSTGAKVGTYTVQDQRGATATATLTVTVSGGTCQQAPGQ